ncbi:hypothetical protein F6455_04395 [Proteobacteria bacterium 005FR1]|nr:hypothetical protein [Proteobacteria bacterium 005FR1]
MKNAPLSALFSLIFVLAATLAGGRAMAATQGSWGTSSTATARITLTIPPRAGDSAPATAGHEALNRFCAASLAFREANQSFTASAAQEVASAHVDGLLRASCEQRSAELENLPHSEELKENQLTVLIAPV